MQKKKNMNSILAEFFNDVENIALEKTSKNIEICFDGNTLQASHYYLDNYMGNVVNKLSITFTPKDAVYHEDAKTWRKEATPSTKYKFRKSDVSSLRKSVEKYLAKTISNPSSLKACIR